MEPSGAFDTFLRQALAFANRKDGDTSLRSCDKSSNLGLRQLASRTTDDGDNILKSSTGSSSAAEVPPLLSSESHSTWW